MGTKKFRILDITSSSLQPPSPAISTPTPASSLTPAKWYVVIPIISMMYSLLIHKRSLKSYHKLHQLSFCIFSVSISLNTINHCSVWFYQTSFSRCFQAFQWVTPYPSLLPPWTRIGSKQIILNMIGLSFIVININSKSLTYIHIYIFHFELGPIMHSHGKAKQH